MAEGISNIGFPAEYEVPGNVDRFSCEAMACVFEIYIQSDDEHYSGQAAGAAFEEVSGLEQELSRFIENSDISQINSLDASEEIRIGLDAFECLKQCKVLYQQTEGAFDVTAGLYYDCWLDEDNKVREPSKAELDFAGRNTGLEHLRLNEDEHTVVLESESIKLDLGGFGKGYAVDKIARVLRQWSLGKALISAGQSSVLALDAPEGLEGWGVSISHPEDREKLVARLVLANRALGGSGLEKGCHIIDARNGKPVTGRIAGWSGACDAATADGLSTAFMVMLPGQIESYVAEHHDISAMIIAKEAGADERKGEILRFGRWGNKDSTS